MVKGKPVWTPKRRPDSRKGDNGRVLVVGGSRDYVGAPALAALAALRAGCDIVKVAAPEKAAWAINALSPDLITIKLDGEYLQKKHVSKIVESARRSDAVLVGPGLAVKDTKLVNMILAKISKLSIPLVIDADAVKLARISSLSNAIITPHSKEFELFLAANHKSLPCDFWELPDSGKVFWIQKSLSDFLAKGNIVLLKGRHDLIVSKERAFISTGGNAGMTVGGTGDILAGLCVGYLAQTKDILESAVMASHNCKRIGDGLLKKSNFGFGFISSDFLKVIKRLR
jgi:NAD(P)H-hydrate epimerase